MVETTEGSRVIRLSLPEALDHVAVAALKEEAERAAEDARGPYCLLIDTRSVRSVEEGALRSMAALERDLASGGPVLRVARLVRDPALARADHEAIAGAGLLHALGTFADEAEAEAFLASGAREGAP